MPSITMAQRFLEALSAGKVRQVIAADAVSWHNIDGVEAPLATLDEDFATVISLFPDFRYANLRYAAAGHSVSLAQFTLMATLSDGGQMEAHGCLVVTERDGLVTRTEEYLDSHQVAPLIEAAGADSAREHR